MYSSSVGGYYYQGPVSDKPRTVMHRSRAVKVLVLVGLITVSIVFGAVMNAYAVNQEDALLTIEHTSIEASYIPHSVQHGESLWSIAKLYQSDHADIRAYIHEIKAMNNLQSSMLREGQLLQIPVYR